MRLGRAGSGRIFRSATGCDTRIVKQDAAGITASDAGVFYLVGDGPQTALKMFDLVWVMTGGGPMNSSEVFATAILAPRSAPVSRCGCVPPIPETQGYVASILALLLFLACWLFEDDYLRERGMVVAEREQNWMIYSLPKKVDAELKKNLKCLQDCVQSDAVFARDSKKLAQLRKRCCEPLAVFATSKS